MVNANKNKGKTVEREICKIFEKYFEGHFQRTFGSGALVGGLNAFRKDFLSKTQTRAAKGDICPPDNMPRMIIECKGYKDLPFHHFLCTSGVNLFEKWCKELEFDVDDDEVGFLVFKINRRGVFIAFKEELLEYNFKLDNYARCNSYIITEITNFLKNDVNKEIIFKITAS